MAEKNLEQAQRYFFIALGIDMAVTAVSVASDFWAIDVLKTIAASGSTASQSDIEYMEFWGRFSVAMVLTTVGVGWTLSRWLGACYVYARQTLGATGLLHEKWKTWGWVTPLWNFFKPYQVLSEIYKVGAPNGVKSDDWKKAPGSGALLMWWFFWTISHLVMTAVFKAISKQQQSSVAPTLNQAIEACYIAIFLCVLSLVIAGLWFVVAGNLTKRLLQRSDQPFKQVTLAKEATHSAPAKNDAYAAALAEIEEDRIDKGTWARCYALSDGDESKAKAAYIKARAEVLGMASEWADTQPAGLDGSHINATSKAGSDNQTSTDFFPKWLVQSAIGLAVFGVLLALALPAYQDYSKRAAVAKAPVQAPSIDSNGWTQESTNSTEIGPWLDYAPVGTRYYRDAKGTIYQLYPPGIRPNAEPANPFGFISSTLTPAELSAQGQAPAPNVDWSQYEPVPNTNPGVEASKTVQQMPPQRDSYVQKVRGLQAAVKRGEIPLTNGVASFWQPTNPAQWLSSDAAVLESTQTWWQESSNEFQIHIQNTMANPLAVLGIDYNRGSCNSNGAKTMFYLTPSRPIAPGSQSIVKFKIELPVSAQTNGCLLIVSAWS